jgi:hypothetical protein
MVLFASWLYVRGQETLIYNQEENKDITHSHISRKKIKQ